jgi:dephospho-CoA kinase
MLKIAITGGIASGKSSILNVISSKFPTISADAEIAKMYENPFILNEISQIFEKKVENKEDIRTLVLENPLKRRLLEKLLHKKLYQTFSDYERKNRLKGAKLCFFEIPLLFEKRKHRNYDASIIANSPLFVRKRRFLQRSGNIVNFNKFNKIQLQLEQKKSFSREINTLICDNYAQKIRLNSKINKIFLTLLKKKSTLY